MKSLRTRAFVGGTVWAVFSVLIGVFGLASYLDNLTQNRFDELLVARHTQAVIEVAKNHQNPIAISDDIWEPAYRQAFSGQYWQVTNDIGEIYVSESLVDALLPAPSQEAGQISISTIAGPTGSQVRRIEEWLTFDDGSRWNVQVASSLDSLNQDRSRLRGNLAFAFGLIAVLGILGAFLQASTTLRPLNDLRRDVLARWNVEGGLETGKYPVEVAPLVTDINTLLERNREIVTRSRRQAADLAHAVKTPSAVVRNELEQLNAAGQPVRQAIDALDRLDAQLKRSFARMRADGGNAAMHTFTDLDASLGRMSRAFGALAKNENKALTTHIPKGLRIRMDQTDFEEVIGNLLDNAMKWSQSTIHIAVQPEDDVVKVFIEDDGPGISKDHYVDATLSGQRLDISKPGTGLGLAIASDLVHAYGGEIDLGASQKLGGLCVRLQFKTSGV